MWLSLRISFFEEMSSNDIKAMNTEEKLQLIETLWDSIDSSSLELSASHKRELDHRLKKHKDGSAEYSTWEEVKQRFDKK
jgi:putative addiction module component (TIGR02574 family)